MKRNSISKKAISIILSLLMVISLCPLTVFASTNKTNVYRVSYGNDFGTYYYRRLSDDTLEIYNEKEVNGEYVTTAAFYFNDHNGNTGGIGIDIPEVLQGRTVTSVASNAFNGIPSSGNPTVSLVSIGIAKTIKSIGDSAFANNGKLRTIDIPDGVEYLGNNLFANCSWLETVTIADSVTHMGNGCFVGCESLKEVKFSSSLEYIAPQEFSGFKQLEKVHLPENLKEIEYGTFESCSSLEEVNLPHGLTKIGECAFYECFNLNEITIPDTVTTIESCAFNSCFCLETVTIPSSVTYIAPEAFEGCYDIETVYVEEGSYAEEFAQNHDLNYEVVEIEHFPYSYNTLKDGSIEITAYTGDETNVVIPAVIYGHNVKGIAPQAFAGDETITSVVVPEGVEYIGDAAFAGCQSLQSVSLPDSVKTIGGYAFAENMALTQVNLPASLESVGEIAFALTSVTELTIPASLREIGMGAFAACIALESFDIDEENESFTVEDGVLFSKDKKELVAFPAGSTETSYEIPKGVKKIGDGAFAYAMGLEEISIPNSVTEIGEMALCACTSLKEVEIPGSVRAIGANAFDGCESLTDIAITSSVKEIGEYALPDTATIHAPEGSAAAQYAEDKGVTLQETFEDVVTYEENNVTITVNKTIDAVDVEGIGAVSADFYRHFMSTDSISAILQEKLEEYYDTDVILMYEGIDDPIAFLAGSEYIDVATGERLFVTDEMLEEVLAPSELLDLSPITLTIEEGITEIPDYAFAFFSEVTEVVLPSTIKNIGEAAFAHCTGLESITLPEGLESIYLGTFDGCVNLTSISMTAYENADEALFYGTPANVITPTSMFVNEEAPRCRFYD